jgi:hypothetical protein
MNANTAKFVYYINFRLYATGDGEMMEMVRMAIERSKANLVVSMTIVGLDFTLHASHFTVILELLSSSALYHVSIKVGDGRIVTNDIVNAIKRCTAITHLALRFRAYVDILSSFGDLHEALPNLQYLELESMNVLGHVSELEDESKFVDTDEFKFNVNSGNVRLFDGAYREAFCQGLSKFKYVKEIKLIRFFLSPVEVRYLDGVDTLTLDDSAGETIHSALGDLSRAPRLMPLKWRIEMCKDARTLKGFILNAIYESEYSYNVPTYTFRGQKQLNVFKYSDKEFVFQDVEKYDASIMRMDFSITRYTK